MIRSGALAVLVAVALAGGAQGQETVAPPLAASEPSLLAEVLVIGRPPGPAMWRVARPGSEVVILGSVTPIPHLQQWDKRRLERALNGADRVLLPPEFKAGAVDAARMFVGQNALKLPRGATLESTLPEPLRARFVEARTRARQPARRYERWKPGVAGFILVNDYREAAGLSGAKPVSTVRRMLKGRRIKVETVGSYRLAPLARSAARLPEAAHLACLDAALDQHEAEAENARRAAEAWAEGDIAAVRASYRTGLLESCLARLPGADALVERGVADTVRAVEAALTRPGKTVAIVDLSLLARPDGVLERLRAAGASVTAPIEG